MKIHILHVVSIVFAVIVASVSARGAEREKPSYIGEKSCLTCHKAQSESFPKNIHNDAYTVISDTERYLKLKKEGKEGSCLRCHVTGYGETGGFTDEASTPDMARVTCEGCHGPGGDHVAASSDDPETKRKTIQRKPDCGACHLIHSHEG